MSSLLKSHWVTSSLINSQVVDGSPRTDEMLPERRQANSSLTFKKGQKHGAKKRKDGEVHELSGKRALSLSWPKSQKQWLKCSLWVLRKKWILRDDMFMKTKSGLTSFPLQVESLSCKMKHLSSPCFSKGLNYFRWGSDRTRNDGHKLS